MNPPPPMFPANGYVTASANPVATAASTALPPRERTAAPMSEAYAETETTIPAVELTGSGDGAVPPAGICEDSTVGAASRAASASEMAFFMTRPEITLAEFQLPEG